MTYNEKEQSLSSLFLGESAGMQGKAAFSDPPGLLRKKSSSREFSLYVVNMKSGVWYALVPDNPLSSSSFDEKERKILPFLFLRLWIVLWALSPPPL